MNYKDKAPTADMVAWNNWFNAVDFRDYFKLSSDLGGSLVFEIIELNRYNAEAEADATVEGDDSCRALELADQPYRD